MLRFVLILLALATAGAAPAETTPPAAPATIEGDFVLHDFRFGSGETLPALRLHYTTLGTPRRDAAGHVANAVLVLHGTGGDGHQFLRPQFSGVLFAPGGLLDPAKYFIVLPDSIGHGKSSKPSDGLHARFPHYDYDDMVEAQYRLLSEGLHVDHLRLLMGTSMGCMHGFVWAETHPDFIDAMMPMACQPVQIAGRNRLWRAMIIDAIRSDPAWRGGDYKEEPREALRDASNVLIMVGSAPLVMQQKMPTRDAADRALDEMHARDFTELDANDLLYQVAASRNYDPSPKLERIKTPILWVNSADDFINPPELGIAERMVTRIPTAKFVLLPISEKTHGHGTHTWAEAWQDLLADLLKRTER